MVNKMKKETIGLILKSAAVSALRKCLGHVHQSLQEQPKMIERKPERRWLRPFAFRPALFLPVLVALCYTSAMAVQQEKTVKVDPESKAVELFWMWPNDDLRLIIQPKDPIRYDIAEFCGRSRLGGQCGQGGLLTKKRGA